MIKINLIGENKKNRTSIEDLIMNLIRTNRLYFGIAASNFYYFGYDNRASKLILVDKILERLEHFTSKMFDYTYRFKEYFRKLTY